jgi:hypothetical protein
MIEDKKRNGLAGLFCGAALLTLAGCGGGGGGSTASAGTPDAMALAGLTPTSEAQKRAVGCNTEAPGNGLRLGQCDDANGQGNNKAPAVAGEVTPATAPVTVGAAPVEGAPEAPVLVPASVSDAPAPAPAPVAAAPVLTASVATALVEAAPVAAAPAPAPSLAVTPVATSSPMLADCEMFPPSAIFNTRIDDVSRFPAHPESAKWVNMVGGSVPFRTDWGLNDNPALASTYWGIPINVVDGTPATTTWPNVMFDFASSGQSMESGWPYKSDCAVADAHGGFSIKQDCTSVPASANRFPFPLPSKVLNENGHCGGPNSCGDHHVLVVEAGACRLWESYYAHQLNGQWYALTTAAWNLRSLDLRPVDWASGDAAGLPIAPLLARAAEASSGEIKHALRVTFRDHNIATSYEWPARHGAGGADPGAIPFGSLLRLKADFVIPADWTPQARALATAAKRYGLYVSDNGENFYVQGEPNAAWDERTFFQMQNIKMSDMEFVNLNSIKSDPRFSPNSMAASW